jgi:hypothetical protein
MFIPPTVDHVVPISAGGSNDHENLQLLCAPCNSSKGGLRRTPKGRDLAESGPPADLPPEAPRRRRPFFPVAVPSAAITDTTLLPEEKLVLLSLYDPRAGSDLASRAAILSLSEEDVEAAIESLVFNGWVKWDDGFMEATWYDDED